MNESSIKLWHECINELGIDPIVEVDDWYFCDSEEDALSLALLVIEGRKKATASLEVSYESSGEIFPKVGSYHIITDYYGEALAVIQTTKVILKPFCEVDEDFAIEEGEGDLSLEYWKSGHRKFFTRECEEIGREFKETDLVVLESFKCIYSKPRIRFGVIGCANIADKQIIPAMKMSKNVSLYGIAGRNKEKRMMFKQKHGFKKVYASYEDLLDDPFIEAVYIPLPNGLHYEWVIKALKKKKHVLCEKPLGLSEREVEEMFSTAKENGVVLMEAFASRQSPINFEVKELIDKGEIGKIKYIETHFTFFLKQATNVRLDASLGGGATYDVGCYNLNLIRYLVGMEPTDVKAIFDYNQDKTIDLSHIAILEFPNGIKAMSHCGFNQTNRVGFFIDGEEGSIIVSSSFNQSGKLEIKIQKRTGEKVKYIMSPNNYMLELEHFSDVIMGKAKPLITYEDSIGNAKIIDEILSQMKK